MDVLIYNFKRFMYSNRFQDKYLFEGLSIVLEFFFFFF